MDQDSPVGRTEPADERRSEMTVACLAASRAAREAAALPVTSRRRTSILAGYATHVHDCTDCAEAVRYV